MCVNKFIGKSEWGHLTSLGSKKSFSEKQICLARSNDDWRWFENGWNYWRTTLHYIDAEILPLHEAFQLVEYQMVLWVCWFDINLGQWPSPHSCHHCSLMAETLVMIPVVTAMPWGGKKTALLLPNLENLTHLKSNLNSSSCDWDGF